MFDKDLQNSRQWRDWNDARQDWRDSNKEQTADHSSPHAHIEHMQENSRWQDNAQWRLRNFTLAMNISLVGSFIYFVLCLVAMICVSQVPNLNILSKDVPEIQC